MTPDFSVIQSEFAHQIAALDQLISTVDVCAGMDAQAPLAVSGRAIPVLGADAENVMAAAAIVSLAAYFESFVRSQVEEYARGVVFHFASLSGESQTRLVDSYWRTSLVGLGRIRPKDDTQWATKAASALNVLNNFPIGGDPQYADPTLLTDHDHNMRFEVIDELVGRVGVKKLGEELYKHAGLKAFIGAPNRNDFLASCKARLFSFQDLRNTLVHRISQSSGIGYSVYEQQRDFIALFAEAFSDSLANKYPLFAARARIGNANLVIS